MYSLIAFFVLICVLVFVHEWGHFWAARRCGVRVLRFSIGFGKVLWRKTDRHGTEFTLSLIPLGGYVRMYQGEESEDEPDENAPRFAPNEAFANKSLAARALIIVMGPLVNLLFAVLLYWGIFIAGVTTAKPLIGNVAAESVAARAGFQIDDEIVRINAQDVRSWEEVLFALTDNLGKSAVRVQVQNQHATRDVQLDLSHWALDSTQNPLQSLGIQPKRAKSSTVIYAVAPDSVAEKAGLKAGEKLLALNGKTFDWATFQALVKSGKAVSLEVGCHEADHDCNTRSLTLQPEKTDKGYRLGIAFQPLPRAPSDFHDIRYGVLDAGVKAVEKVISLSGSVAQTLKQLITGNLSPSNLGGPIAIAQGAAGSAEQGVLSFLAFMALISVNLGVMNLLPILPLDGGQLVLLAMEGIIGKKYSVMLRGALQWLGVLLVLGLMVFTVINDLLHF